MLIKGEEKYIDTLSCLWQSVFGDNEDYIKLFFSKAYPECECFAETENGVVVSALYLLKCNLNFDGSIFNGRYLYAAATLSTHRSRGLMGKLIDEAKTYCKNEGIDFIALVPASDSLYSYYEKFGFKEAMYKYRYVVDCLCYEAVDSFKKTERSLHTLRKNCKENMLIFSEGVNAYAEKAMRFSDAVFFENATGAYFTSDVDFTEFYEFIPVCSEDEKSLLRFAELGSVVYAPCECPLLGDGEKVRNGMLYCVTDSAKNKDFSGDVYMNIALD